MTDRIYTGTGTIHNAGGFTQEDMYAIKGAMIPVGSIVSFIGAAFGNTSNGGAITYPLTGGINTVAAVKSYIEASTNSKWTVCDGHQILDSESLFNNKYTPNLTDDRFLRGSTTGGNVGGSNSTTLSTSNLPPHDHSLQSHTHSISGAASSGHNHPTSGLYATIDTQNGSGLLTINNASAPAWTSSRKFTATAYGSTPAFINTTVGVPLVGSMGTPTASAGNSGAPSASNTGNGSGSSTSFSNEPNYISCFFLIRIK